MNIYFLGQFCDRYEFDVLTTNTSIGLSTYIPGTRTCCIPYSRGSNHLTRLYWQHQPALSIQSIFHDRATLWSQTPARTVRGTNVNVCLPQVEYRVYTWYQVHTERVPGIPGTWYQVYMFWIYAPINNVDVSTRATWTSAHASALELLCTRPRGDPRASR